MAYALSCWSRKLAIFPITNYEISLIGERDTIRLLHDTCTSGLMLVDTEFIVALYVEVFISLYIPRSASKVLDARNFALICRIMPHPEDYLDNAPIDNSNLYLT